MVDCKHTFLSANAAARLEELPFKDCILVLKDAKISCHRLKLADVSNVLGAVLQDLDPACVVPLLEEDTATVAPMLELAYGSRSFKIDRSNYRAALRCHEKYACPALRAAAEQWMMHCARELGRNLSLWELQQLLQTANEFGVDRVRMACLDIAVFGFSDIMRGAGADELADMDPPFTVNSLKKQVLLACGPGTGCNRRSSLVQAMFSIHEPCNLTGPQWSGRPGDRWLQNSQLIPFRQRDTSIVTNGGSDESRVWVC